MNIVRTPSYLFDLIYTLVERELRIRYKGSILGLLWAILSPLGTVLILYILFSRILPLNIPHYAAFIYSGLLPWTWFQASMYTSAAALNDNRDLVRKPFFPRLILPGVVMVTNFILYLLALPVLIILITVEGLSLTPALLYLPIVWFLLGIIILGFTMIISALGVLIRDIQHLLGVVMLLWFYMTPIFYEVPDQSTWLYLNPMAVLVAAHRDILMYGQTPHLLYLGILALLGGLLFLAGVILFRSLEDVFVEEV
jgi:lipopolysaccharide transport system permease protein